MKKVITYGTFDMFHEGHYNILKRAKEYGDYLVVAVTGESYDIGRGKLSVRDSLAVRMENVRKSGFADQIIVEEYLGQKISDIIKYGIDVFVIGDDWKGKFDHMADYCELVYLPRTEGISSTQIREETFDKHRIGIIADRVSDNTIVSDAKKVSGFFVDRVYSEKAGIAEEFKEKYSLEKSCTDLEEFYKGLDIVYIRTELADRYRFIKDAIEAGKHVISDTPFTIDVDKEKELLDLAASKDVILMHNIKAIHTQVFIQLLWMIKAGLIGDILHVDCNASKNDKNIRQLFYELTTDALTMMFNTFGTKYEDISKTVVNQDGSLEYMLMNVKYPKFDVSINIGNQIRVENKIEIIGTQGTIRLGENWWRADSFEQLTVGEDFSKKFHVNYDGNGFKFIIKDMSIMMNEGRREYRLMNRALDLAITEVLQGIED